MHHGLTLDSRSSSPSFARNFGLHLAGRPSVSPVPCELRPSLTDGAEYCLLRGILQHGHSVNLHAPVRIRLPPGLPQGEDATTPDQHAYLSALMPRHARFTFPEAVRSSPAPQASARAAGVPQHQPHRVFAVVPQTIIVDPLCASTERSTLPSQAQ
ncbi:hypothetical protein DFH09DRAFT_1083330 [Mycena vulgaris]|nr:hypothetical protein DFH09DRAFT_1083330 [Mycena vulgaris]